MNTYLDASLKLVEKSGREIMEILSALPLENVHAAEYIVTAKAHMIHAMRDFVKAVKILKKMDLDFPVSLLTKENINATT